MSTIATLCSGGELFGVGARDAGLAHLWGIEADADKDGNRLGISAVAAMNGFASIVATVQSVDYSSLEVPYWLHMSPPCTNASNANTQGGETELDIEIAEGCIRAIRTLRPPVVSLENVLGYRKFESFKRICHALREEGYALEWRSLLASDYGVPQTRRRLFLVASRVSKPSKPAPTHQKRKKETGQLSLFAPLPVWVGWYEAIEDLIPELPEDEFAPWQLPLLPDEIKTMLIAQGKYGDKLVTAGVDDPSFTITANSNQMSLRCLSESSANSSNGLGIRGVDDPAMTVTANMVEKGTLPRALLMRNDNQKQEWGKGYREPHEPAITVTRKGSKAFIVDGQANSHGESVTVRNDDAPCIVVNASQEKRPLRAYTGGRVVRMTPRCLARFQSIPDSYILPERASLACTVIGNAVPPKMAEALVRANFHER